mmetsp:Transcript_10376/g.7747  ORF Transcript_10376/g.7747 Transcript_10376/m.7747 type:complete len:114 (+) Transcript_10376:80-421(+)
MLMHAFQRIEDFRKEMKLKHFHLQVEDVEDLSSIETSSFDTVVATFVLEALFDVDAAFAEMVRVCRPGGKILILSRGASHFWLYNEWLRFKAAQDLANKGWVEHLDIKKVVER